MQCFGSGDISSGGSHVAPMPANLGATLAGLAAAGRRKGSGGSSGGGGGVAAGIPGSIKISEDENSTTIAVGKDTYTIGKNTFAWIL